MKEQVESKNLRWGGVEMENGMGWEEEDEGRRTS